MRSNSERSTSHQASTALVLLFVTSLILGPQAFAQYGSSAEVQSYVKTVDYVYKGQKYQFKLIRDQVRQVLKDGQLLLMVTPTMVIEYPGSDPKAAAAAQDALKAYQAEPQPLATAAASAGPPAQAGLTVDGVVAMLQAGITEDIIIEKIRKSGQSFDLSADDMVRLKKAMASNNLLKAMMGATPATATPAPVQAAAGAARGAPMQAPAAQAPSSAPQSASPAASPGHGILQADELERLYNGTVRFDLSAIRLNPALLDQKVVMQYFVGLNNCQDRDVEHALQNELDYPALAQYYKSKAPEILAALPNTVGLAMFIGNTKGASLWGRSIGGWDPSLKTLALGEYDTGRKAFPVLVSDKSPSFEVSGTLHVDINRSSLQKSCPVAYNAIIRSSEINTALPSSDNVTIKPRTFNELPMNEADARKYIESVNSSKRQVYLTVDVHVTGDTPPASAKEMDFSGDIARITVLSSGSNQNVGVLYDDRTLAPPATSPRPTRLTTMKTEGDFRLEISTVVYLGLSSDSCGWPLTSEQKANLKRYMSDINNYGKFNDKYALNSEIGSVRESINSQRLAYCESRTERQQFDRRVATLWPSGPIAAPAGQ